MGITLAVSGAAVAAAGVALLPRYPLAGVLSLWFGAAFAAVGAAYFRRTPGVFGKTGDGRLSPLRAALLFPYLVLSTLFWEVKVRLRREPVFHEIAPNLFLGRRPRGASELPPGTALVVDLTAEFAAAPGIVTAARRYRCLPTLDHDAPPNRTAFDALVREVAGYDAPVYVHCAIGRGRSALFVAAVLRARGCAADNDAAWEQVRAARPVVGLSGVQAAFLYDATTPPTSLESESNTPNT